MSNIYIQEPPTNGKVLLTTSVGEIDIELWSKECPKAARNFIQLCMEGYYDGTIFHRVIKDFIVQGGDPTGTGDGGESIYGGPFKDEIHSRLRFNRRGLVAMANAGPHDNLSQFFLTLGEATELQKKHTLFGKVTGNTIFNMIKLGEVETDGNDRPLYPHKIIKTRILSNPYDDIIPRALPSREGKSKDKKKSKSKATKDFKLLSFGEEAEEDEEEVNEVTKDMKHKGKSIHDLDIDPKLSAEPAVNEDELKKRSHSDSEEDETNEDSHKMMKKDDPDTPEDNEEDSKNSNNKEMTKSEKLREEVRQLKKQLMVNKLKKEVVPEKPEEPENEDDDAIKEFKKVRQQYKDKRKEMPKKGSSREEQTLAMLSKFQSKLQQAKEESGDKQEEIADGDTDEIEDTGDIGWLGHKLEFTESSAQKVIDANVQELDRYEIFDPRNPMTKRRREDSKKKMKDKK